MHQRRMIGVGVALAIAAVTYSSGCVQAQAPGESAGGGATVPAGDFWGSWPAGADPVVAGQKMIDNLLPQPLSWQRPNGEAYPEICAGYGALRFCGAIRDEARLKELVDRYNVILTARGHSLIAPPDHVDRSVFGIVPLEIFMLTASPAEKQVALAAVRAHPGPYEVPGNAPPPAPPRRMSRDVLKQFQETALKEAQQEWDTMKLSHQDQETAWLRIGLYHADQQWAHPRLDGLTDQTRMWVDDMFMIPGIQTQAYRATGDKVYLDRVAKQMAVYIDKLQQPNGLFFHADDAPFYWGRGDGWFAAGMAEVLTDLPKDHPEYARIMSGYRKMMAGLLKYQAPSGMWRQLIDNDQAWEESSGSGMFTFAMARGVREGWLPEPEYKAAAKKAWVGLSSHLNAEGNVTDTCVGTNKASMYSKDKATMLQYYLHRGKTTGDLHGQLAFIWAAYAMVK